ncbi:hypothetical protein IMSAGC011_01601 [Lachnospiraceae bacterium]|nr:hypothetical protein IMSAGC011_01601 [Lachnospiraceae bacterium]
MNKVKDILKICVYQFRIQMVSKRVWLGYLLGIVIIMKQSFGYFVYADSLKESINVLEAFVIAGNNYNTAMFLVLGWLLVISEAPFINSNSLYLIYRTNKKNWNAAMILYIFYQAIIYYSLIAGCTMLFSVKNGFFSNVWSNPIVRLTENVDKIKEINVYFPYTAFIKEISVFQAFLYTWILCFLYGLILGLFLYTFNLFSNQIAGAVAVFLFHFLGYEIMKEGFMVIIKYSLLARSIPVLQIGEDLGVTFHGTLFVYAITIFMLNGVSKNIVKFTDFREASRGEGE